jgi:S-adenosylmethionine decarboxylase proenzyme
VDHRGTHLIVDLYGCKRRPGEGAETLLAEIARRAGLTVLAKARHGFPGGGETALLLLSQSHCSVHTWPEVDYVAIDLYSCKPMPEDLALGIVEFLRERLGAGKVEHRLIERGHAAALPETLGVPAD